MTTFFICPYLTSWAWHQHRKTLFLTADKVNLSTNFAIWKGYKTKAWITWGRDREAGSLFTRTSTHWVTWEISEDHWIFQGLLFKMNCFSKHLVVLILHICMPLSHNSYEHFNVTHPCVNLSADSCVQHHHVGRERLCSVMCPSVCR
jgi:hypothetical protein